MTPEELDRILSEPDEIVPSSGFAANVMDAVQRESSAPPPIRFPWQRAVPGFSVAAALAIITALTGPDAVEPPAAVTWAAAAIVAMVVPLAILRRVVR
jgi:hypothetical protein